MKKNKEIIRLIRSGNQKDLDKSINLLMDEKYELRKQLQSLIKSLPSYESFEGVFHESIMDLIFAYGSVKNEMKNPKGLLFTICRNKLLSRINKSQRRGEGLALIEEFSIDAGIDIAKDMGHKEMLNWISLLLSDNMTNDCRKIIWAKHYDDKSHEEIAEEMELTYKSSKNKLSRCMSKIKSFCKNHLPSEVRIFINNHYKR